MNEERELRQRIEEALDAVLVNMIVEEVLRRIAAMPKNCLFVFNGSLTGFGAALDTIKLLQSRSGVCMNAVLTPGARQRLPREKIVSVLGKDHVADSEDSHTRKLFENADIIALPTLTMSTAAKIAVCIRDTAATQLISDAIIGGKKIIASIDGAVPVCESVPQNYRRKATQNLESLAGFGIELTSAELLGRKLLKLCDAAVGHSLKKPEKFINDTVITCDQLLGLDEEDCISIFPNAIITPLAYDLIYKKRIKIYKRTEE